MKTIVEITDINGSKERGIVHQVKDLTFAKNCKQTLKIEIVQKGSDWFEVAQFLGIEQSGEITLYEWKKDSTFREHKQQITHLKSGKIRVETGISDWRGRAQKLKDGPHGQYITVFGQRRYID